MKELSLLAWKRKLNGRKYLLLNYYVHPVISRLSPNYLVTSWLDEQNRSEGSKIFHVFLHHHHRNLVATLVVRLTEFITIPSFFKGLPSYHSMQTLSNKYNRGLISFKRVLESVLFLKTYLSFRRIWMLPFLRKKTLMCRWLVPHNYGSGQ